MDNKAYLDQIAVKGKKNSSSGPILSPLMIKLIIVAVVAIIAIIIVSSMISAKKAEGAKVDQMVYTRIVSLTKTSNPMLSFQKKLRSSDLRGNATNLNNSLLTTKRKIDSVASAIKLKTSDIDPEVSDSNSSAMSTYKAELTRAKLNGHLDRTYAISTAYQISMLISLEKQARSKATNGTYASALDSSISDLEILYENFQKYTETH